MEISFELKSRKANLVVHPEITERLPKSLVEKKRSSNPKKSLTDNNFKTQILVP